MNIVKIRYTFLNMLMMSVISSVQAVPNVTRAFGVQPEGYTQSQVKYHEVGSSDHFSR